METKPFCKLIRETWDGRRVVIGEMDHQHLSNTVHFYTHLFDNRHGSLTASKFTEEIVRRFDGELLPYRPDPEFNQEIKDLNNKGMLRQRGNSMDYDIVVGTQVIGEILNIDLGSYYI